MSDATLSTSGSGFAAQALSAQHQVAVLNKAKEIKEQEGEAQLKLLNSVPQAAAPPLDPSSPVGQNVNVKV